MNQRKLLETMDRRFFGNSDASGQGQWTRSNKRLDVASRMREMW